jgi:hypothetical protein
MGGPGHQRGEKQRDQRLCRHRAEEKTQARHVFVRRDDDEKLAQGQEHEPKADRHAAEVAGAARVALAKHHHADEEQKRRGLGDLEREKLNDERGADIGAEHHRQGRDEIDEAAGRKSRHHEAGRRAALQDGGDAEPRRESLEAIAERPAEHAPQIGAEGTLSAALDHMKAPQQQRDRAGEIEQGKRRIHRFASPARFSVHASWRILGRIQEFGATKAGTFPVQVPKARCAPADRARRKFRPTRRVRPRRRSRSDVRGWRCPESAG